ncbi:hypothetical protein [Nocardia fluminea]|uniref:hypothetical protein n=1 Tax=Nocardia fluminea TaxID=134984 RepID=UPI0034097AA0
MIKMNTLSTRTIGYLTDRAADIATLKELRALLLSSGIADAAGLDSTFPQLDRPNAPNKMSFLAQVLSKAQQNAQRGSVAAHTALLEFVEQWVSKRPAFRSEGPLRDSCADLFASLRRDGYELDFTSDGCRLLPIDSSVTPLGEEISALTVELNKLGYELAAHHYGQAVNSFRNREFEAANGQIRTMLEALVVALAIEHTGYTDTGRANQGGAAIRTLWVGHTKTSPENSVKGQPMQERDGGALIQGLWHTLHTRGSHPGYSDEGEARLRLHLVTTAARFLLNHFETP